MTSMNRSFLGDVSPPSSMDSPSLSTAFCPVDDMLADTSTPGFDSFLKEVCSEHVADVVEHLDMTFPIVDLLPEPTGEHFDQTFPIVDLPELSDMELLNGTYDLDKEASEVRLSFSGFEPNVANQCCKCNNSSNHFQSIPNTQFFIPKTVVYQSTPMKSALDQTHPVAPDVPTVKQPGLNTTIVVDNCDNPPPFDHSKYQTYVRTKQKPAVVSQNQQWTNECVGQSADDRQSLTNFEEFEKSMSMCQNETDFELMLNNISKSGGRMTGGDSMRKSLDHIKKRHSLMNLEKQLEDQRRSVASAATVDANRTTTASQKPTAMDGSFGSTLSSSGSGERLLRRSRVCDELADDLSSGIAPPCQLITKTTTTTIDITNPTTVDPSAHIPAETVTANPTLPVPRAGIPTRDRDRFKTIRISKHAPAELPAGMHIPCATAADVHPMPTDVIQPPVPQTDNRTLVEGLAPRRELLRPPSQLKAIARRDASLGVTRKLSALPSVIRDGSAAAVTKAKSIHNLATGYERSVEKSAEEINAGNQKEVSIEIFEYGLQSTSFPNSQIQVRQTNQFRLPLPAQRIGKLSGLIRPSSGYFSYNVRRNDSDTESGRMSPTNVSRIIQ